MRHVSRTHRVALDGLFDRINLDSKIQINFDTLTPKTNSQTYWPRETSHVRSGIILCLLNTSLFSSTGCSEVMSKRQQKDAGEEWVTAKSKPMMNLVSRYSVRDPDVLASTASESPRKTRHESQLPLSSWNEQHQRTVRRVKAVLDAYSSNDSDWNADKNWSSQEWKSDELMEIRTGRFVNKQPPGFFTQHTDRFIVENDKMESNTEAESEMSFKSRSFLHRVNDRVWKRQYQSSKDATKDSDKHSVIWKVYVFYITSICFHGKELLRQFTFHQKNRRSHNKTDVWHVWKVDSRTIRWDLWSNSNQLGRSFTETIIVGRCWRSHQSLAREGLRIFRFCVMFWKDAPEPAIKLCMGRQVDVVQKFIRIESFGHNLMVSQCNSSGFFSQDSPHCSLSMKSKSSWQKWAHNQKISLDGLSSCRCSTTSHDDLKTMHRNAIYALSSFLLCEKIFTRKMVILRTWIRKEVVFFLW